jgi:hypothetical protein
MDTAKFKRLRSLLVYRLTMCNGTRGVDPAKMTIADWIIIELDQHEERRQEHEQMHPLERGLLQNSKLAYMAGNGGRLVPILIPYDCFDSIRTLVQLRSSVPINPENMYLFAACNGSLGHIRGSQAINDVCRTTGSSLRAADFTHRVLTIYMLKELPEEERSACYEHMTL